MSDAGYPAWQGAFAPSSHYNAISFLIRQMMAQAVHIALVTVKAVHAQDDPLQPPTVDVQPMVAMIDQKGTAKAHATIFKVPTFRIQGGKNAIICDPEEGDIGIMVCADRDISSAIDNQAPSNPGSFRRFDWSDGLYLGGVARITPTNYIQLTDDGITIQLPAGKTLTINADTVNVRASDGSSDTDIEITGSATASVDVVADSVSLHDHVHSGVTTGSGDTGPPT